ncbi:MAG: malonate decarboxylase holo-ACP synthase [Rhizomicrobium sp.]
MTHFRPHDLIRLPRSHGLTGVGPTPAWVRKSLAVAPWVVVRRTAALPPGTIAVGVRGPERNLRWGGIIPASDAMECWTPETVSKRYLLLSEGRRRMIPALTAIRPFTEILRQYGLVGGPTGSVGFELVSGRPTATVNSDLDAVIQTPQHIARDVAQAIMQAVSQLPVRCDVQLETPGGAITLAEYAFVDGPIALRGSNGPHLVRDPWAITGEKENTDNDELSLSGSGRPASWFSA